ncbi:MAG: hypothetical protein M3461_24145 [Pseudomonadota bacterium]|nr:hypothetical protein [Pseudomonadota bacterium]
MSDFVICIDNDSNPASLIPGRVYRTLPDAEAEAHNMLRIIDEDKSEPDGYLYANGNVCTDRSAGSGKTGADGSRRLNPNDAFCVKKPPNKGMELD